MQRRRERVVVTGLGAVSPLGLDAESTWQNCLAGQSGVRRVSLFDTENWPVQIGGEVVGFDLDPYVNDSIRDLAPILPRGPQFGAAAAHMAMVDSGLDQFGVTPHRLGCSMGSLNTSPSLAEMNRWRHLEEEFDPPRYAVVDAVMDMWMSQVAAVKAICNHWRCGGPYYLTSAACASGTMSLGVALKAIRRGDADVMLAGGFDGMLDEVTSMSFEKLTALTKRNSEPERASRPFDIGRDGFVLAEGAAVLVLEELQHALRRGAKIYAEVSGYAASMTSEHVTDTSPDGRHPARAMTLAIRDAGVRPQQVNYINAHGTSTKANDVSETLAIRKALGEYADRAAVSSTKSMMGHLLHAAGAIEAVLCILAIRDQIAPPTINLDEPDPDCDLDYVPNHARDVVIDAAASNSFAFAGNNATIIFRRYTGDGGVRAGGGAA